ncbi:MAG TPA: hypothetical protein VK898_05815 [Chloroflexota bacterium]|nr:hypothetical protein [Chloroflexota bacterium]
MPAITEDVEEFVRLHREHGQLVGDATEPTLTGSRVTIRLFVRRDVRAARQRGGGSDRPGDAGAAELTTPQHAVRQRIALWWIRGG